MLRRQRMRGVAAAVAVAAAVMLAACGGGTSSTSGGGGASSSTPSLSASSSASPQATVTIPADFCGSLSASDLQGAMGQAVPTAAPLAAVSAGEQDCANVSNTADPTYVSFSIMLGTQCVAGQPASSACLADRSAAFAQMKQFYKSAPQDISGLGTQAYCVPGAPINGIVVGSLVYVLDGWIYINTSADTCAHAQAVAAALIAKF